MIIILTDQQPKWLFGPSYRSKKTNSSQNTFVCIELFGFWGYQIYKSMSTLSSKTIKRDQKNNRWTALKNAIFPKAITRQLLISLQNQVMKTKSQPQTWSTIKTKNSFGIELRKQDFLSNGKKKKHKRKFYFFVAQCILPHYLSQKKTNYLSGVAILFLKQKESFVENHGTTFF